MKKTVNFLFTLLISCSLYGQDFWRDNPFLHNTSTVDSPKRLSFITLEGALNFGSDGVNNQFITKLWRGGYMDSMFVENATSQLLPVNRFGVSTTAGITYGMQMKDSVGSILTFSLLNRNNISGKFTDDAFRLGFQGNTQYKGIEADISGTRFSRMSWNQLKIGYSTQETKNTVVSVAFSLLAGTSYNEANVSYGKLFTDSQGLFVDGSVAADYYASDTSNTSPFALNGFGTAVDVSWMYFRPLAKGTETYKIEFLDFGFINWNKKTIHRYVDTTFHYEGVDITELFTNPDYVVDLPETDNIIKSDTVSLNRSTFLPAVIRGSYMRTFNSDKIGIKAVAAVPLWTYALPFGSLTMRYSFMKAHTTVSSGIAYGGYSRFQVPLKAEFWLIKNTAIEVGATNLLVFVSPTKFSGNGVFFKLSYCL